MEIIVANVDHHTFDIEQLLEDQVGCQLLPFSGMDKSTAAVCSLFTKGYCTKGVNCPFRHIKGDRTVVCKHWLRGLCKKGDNCEFLHEYDMTKMPECYFYSRFKACHNKECPFLHINPDENMKDCLWYDRGFCRHGPFCRSKHVRRVLCTNYFAGFCPDGNECKFMHPDFELPPIVEEKAFQTKKPNIVCHYCGQTGHKITHCFKIHPERNLGSSSIENLSSGGPKLPNRYNHPGYNMEVKGARHDNITCFKCGQQGHFANRCTKGQFAFLNSNPGTNN